MKNKIAITAALLLLVLVPSAMAAYEYTQRVTVENFVDRKNNFLINFDGETWLIHHASGCVDFEEGDELDLVIRGDLDGYSDYLKKGRDNDTCAIDQAEVIDGTLRVSKVSTVDTNTLVTDNNGQEYRIYYSTDCKALKGLNGQDVYFKGYGYQLQAGDELFLPGNAGSCALRTVQAVIPLERETQDDETVTADIKLPTTPTNVRAIPMNDAVYVYWSPSTDNEGISHYIINASLYHTEDASVRSAGDLVVLDNEIPTDDSASSFRVTDLQPDEKYFFRVVAVDTSGNRSSYWSEEATATTKSAIHDVVGAPATLKVAKTQETRRSFLFRWNPIPGAGTHTVILEVDGERTYINSHWTRSYVRISKKAERKGKDLKLIVRTLSADGRLQHEDSVSFSF
jgi:hypothetical protein